MPQWARWSNTDSFYLLSSRQGDSLCPARLMSELKEHPNTFKYFQIGFQIVKVTPSPRSAKNMDDARCTPFQMGCYPHLSWGWLLCTKVVFLFKLFHATEGVHSRLLLISNEKQLIRTTHTTRHSSTLLTQLMHLTCPICLLKSSQRQWMISAKLWLDKKRQIVF